MRILMVNTRYPPTAVGGAERSVAELAVALRQAGLSVDVAHLSATGSTSEGLIPISPPRWSSAGDATARRSGRVRKVIAHVRDIYDVQQARRLRAVIRKYRPDVVHTHNLAGFSIAVWAEASRARIPIVHTVRDYYLMCLRSTMYRRGDECGPKRCLECRMACYPRALASSSLTGVIGISSLVLDSHLGSGYFWGVSQRVVIPNIPPQRVLAPRSQQRRTSFAYVGQLTPEKGVLQLLDAFRGVRDDDLRLEIQGRGPSSFEAVVRERASEDWRVSVRQAGPIYPILFRTDALVVPSMWREPLGRVVAEASAYGVPVLISNRGGLVEAARFYGARHLVFDPASRQGFADAIEEASRDRFEHSARDDGVTRAEVVSRHMELYSRSIQTKD